MITIYSVFILRTLTWLDRRGNGKVHGTTKRKPAEVFNEERKYLRPVLEKIQTKSTGLSITYQVRKDNTVVVEGNRYSVPLGTYQGPYTYVRVRKINNEYIVIMRLVYIQNKLHSIIINFAL